MEEATANINMKIEQKNFIINYNKILLLNNGKIEEFDTPTNLLKNEKSLFFRLYSKSTM